MQGSNPKAGERVPSLGKKVLQLSMGPVLHRKEPAGDAGIEERPDAAIADQLEHAISRAAGPADIREREGPEQKGNFKCVGGDTDWPQGRVQNQ